MGTKKITIILILFLFHTFIFAGDYEIHKLQDGETLWRISKNYNISLEELCKINNIQDVTKVKKGTELKIPLKNKEIKKEKPKNVKNFLNYPLPLKGNVKPFVTSHYRGIIIFNETKTSVIAVDDGEVNYVDTVAGYGIVVFIKHKNNLISTYSGFDKVYIKVGSSIKANQIIGISGNLSRYEKPGILFSLQHKGKGLKFDMEIKKFYSETL